MASSQKLTNMKVLFLTIGAQTSASSRTRVYQYLPHLKQHGLHTTVLAAEPNVVSYLDNFRFRLNGLMRKAYNRLYHLFYILIVKNWRYFKCWQVVRMAPNYDVVYIQKIDLPPNLYSLLRCRAKRIVYDIDDAIFLNERRRKQVNEQIQTSDLTIVASEYLVAHVHSLNANVAVLPTPIDTDRYKPRLVTMPDKSATRPITIGWIGSETNTKYINLISPVLQELLLRFGERVQLSFVGADSQQLLIRPANVYPWSLKSELTHLHSFDIGIMPLPESDEWAVGKAGYKLLQYMTIGIPCVASPIGANKTIIRQGHNGFLASNQSEWVNYLSQLIESPTLRHEMGAHGRKMAEENYSHRFLVNRLVDLLAPFAK